MESFQRFSLATSRINCRTNLSLGRQAITSTLRHPYSAYSTHIAHVAYVCDGTGMVCYVILYVYVDIVNIVKVQSIKESADCIIYT